jgi:hypothetical protein
MSLRSPGMRRVEVVASGQHLGRWQIRPSTVKSFPLCHFFRVGPRAADGKVFRIHRIFKTSNRHNDCSMLMSLLNPNGEEHEL